MNFVVAQMIYAMFRILPRFATVGINVQACRWFVRDIQYTDIFHIHIITNDDTRYIEHLGIKGYCYNEYFLVTQRMYNAYYAKCIM